MNMIASNAQLKEDSEVIEASPVLLNDAEILGTEVPGFADFLNKPATFLVGEMWGAKDRRNTQDGKWSPVTMTWRDWIHGGPRQGANPAWGFSRHPSGKDKAGPSIVLGSSVEGARKAAAMGTMYAMGLDIDSGTTYADMVDKLEDLGRFALIYTTHSHGKTGLELKRDDVLRKLQITGDPTLEQVQTFLREHAKDRYEDSFVDAVTIREQKQTASGIKIILDTPPLEKFRLIFPLAEPVNFMDLTKKLGTHQAALAVWEDKITGLARNLLGVHFDTSCTDPSRLFYTARHPKGGAWDCAIIQGEPLDFESVEPMRKADYTSNRDGNPFTTAGGNDDRPTQCYAPSGASLNEWHHDAKSRFQIADMLEHLCPDKIRHAGGEAEGHVHIECPFEHEHSSEGGTATMAVNALDSQSEYWSIWCHHDACQGRHKLQFLEEMLRAGWFEESALTDLDSGYLLDAADGEDDPFAPLPEELADESKTPAQRAEAFTTESSEEDIRKFIKKLFREGVDKVQQANVTAAIVKSTNLGKRDVNALWKELVNAQMKRDKEREKDKEQSASVAVVNQWGFEELCEHADRRIHDTNQRFPRVFHNFRDLAVIQEDSNGVAGIRVLNKGGFEHLLNTVARFVKVSGEDKDSLGVSAPDDVVRFLFNDDYGKYPSLRGLVTTPIFTEGGSLLTKQGYDWGSSLYYRPDLSMSVPEVYEVPTEAEVFEAKRLLVQEVLGDFMLDGMDRAEVLRKVLCCEEKDGDLVPIPGAVPEPTPSLAHAITMALFPFVREMIPGNAPGIAIDKQKAGAGAGKLEAAMSTIFAGKGTAAMAMPTTPEEMTKVLLPTLRSGSANVFFDNVSGKTDSGELASAMTAPTYQARVLGLSETVEVDVRCQWVVAGIKVQLSEELARRFCLIYLDPKTANPENRTGFRHAEIEAWVRANRGQLIWACLTLVQNWIAQGSKPGTKNKASYSQWARIMGGILDAAGIHGFLDNEKAMKERADVSDDPVKMLVERLAEFEDGQLYVTGSVAARHPAGTVSIKATLEGFHEDEDQDAQSLRLPGWGYDKHDGTYSNPQKLGSGFKRDIVGEPHKVGDVEVTLVPFKNSSGVQMYRMRKRAG
jgi:CRISPR/Cas system CSM-associated protein Csm2 small subunit